MKTITPRLQPTDEVVSELFLHANQLVPVLDRVGNAVAVCFDGFTDRHPLNKRDLPRLLAAGFPESSGAFECTVDIPGQRWFILRASAVEIVRDAALAVLRRIGLLRFARVFVSEQHRTLVAYWPVPGERLDFSSVSLDLQPRAGLAASPHPATANEPRPAIAGNTTSNRFTKLLQKLLLPLAHLKPGKGREPFTKRCKIHPQTGQKLQPL
ncbi:MAG: hypothetical protein HOP33_01865 [Verrucomicrobia bacterium]|nr:hypothetical protein [Verrucomicrobiota bacterium]